MTVANQNAAPSSLVIDTARSHMRQQWKVLQFAKLVLQRMLWRLNAYGVVFKVMFLTLGSLLFLYIHWMSRNVVSLVSSYMDNKQ